MSHERNLSSSLPKDISDRFRALCSEWDGKSNIARLWNRDATLWTGTDEAQWMGWLDIVEAQRARARELRAFGEEVKREGFTHALLLGMGGSSLGPEVLETVFGSADGHPQMHVLDSTDPAQVLSFERKVDLARTLFVVSSKSGSTLEPNIFKQYFFQRVRETVGERAGQHFVAITDPGSKLEAAAKADRFRRIFHGVPSIGGRYSVLSDFGLVPAAIQGIDVERLLDHAQRRVAACAASGPAADNPGVALGLLLGAAATLGRDKLTILTSPPLWDVGAWLEQLVAESTGKLGKALIPVDGERPGAPAVYGNDRVFVVLRLDGASDARLDQTTAELERAALPVVRIRIADPYDLGAEFFRWEIATAVAGAVLQINPFNQPDVEASKIETRKLTDEVEAHGSLPAESPFLESDGVKLFADPRNAEELLGLAQERTLAGVLAAHLGRLGPGDYFGLLAYLEMNELHRERLQFMRQAVRDARRVATCLGFGPRFLHSTGQAYKGGPNSGVFLQLTCDDAQDLAVPGARYTFGVVKAAQARGDFAVLAERGRRALRLHLGADVKTGLARVADTVARVLGA
ncbi:MAG: bifunctional transaldolase/phosoglucose isomerase [Acidobacteriota bacterium]